MDGGTDQGKRRKNNSRGTKGSANTGTTHITMSKFIRKPDLKKQKRQKIWDYITIAFGVLYLSLFLFRYRKVEGEEGFLFRSVQTLFFLYLMYWSAFRLFSKKKDIFIEITGQHIAFRTAEWGNEKTRLTLVAWEDIKWIRQETNFSVSIFLASSFNVNFSFKEFPAHDQERILQEIRSFASEKQIRLVNFSELFVWSAV